MKNKTRVMWLDKSEPLYSQLFIEIAHISECGTGRGFTECGTGRGFTPDYRDYYYYINVEIIDTDLFKELFYL